MLYQVLSFTIDKMKKSGKGMYMTMLQHFSVSENEHWLKRFDLKEMQQNDKVDWKKNRIE